MTSESFWNYYRDEINDDANENNAGNVMIKSNKTIARKSFEYKTKKQIKIIPANYNTLDTEFVAPLKYLISFWSLHD